MEDRLEVILNDIEAEMIYQDSKWGGPEHDDKHSADDWEYFIMMCLRGLRGVRRNMNGFRGRMVMIAAVAIQAIKAWDRKNQS